MTQTMYIPELCIEIEVTIDATYNPAQRQVVGTVPVLVTWDRSKHSEIENAIIEKYIDQF